MRTGKIRKLRWSAQDGAVGWLVLGVVLGIALVIWFLLSLVF